MMDIILFLELILAIFMPYIMCAIIAAIIISLITTEKIKSKKFKILIIISIILCVCIILFNIKDERPDDLCIEMNEINDNQSLIGLTKEQVVELLGEPMDKFDGKENNEVYRYDAGSMDRGLFFFNKAIIFDSSYGCWLNVIFDENDKVKHTTIKYFG